MNAPQLSLEVVVAGHCPFCHEALEVADALQREFPTLAVRVIDLDAPNVAKPDVVFAVPSYLLNGKIVSLGNPEPEELGATIRARLQVRDERAANVKVIRAACDVQGNDDECLA